MPKQKSKAQNLKEVFSRSHETQLTIVKVIDSIIKQLELNLLAHDDQGQRPNFRLMNIIKKNYDGIDSGDALMTGRILNRCISGFEFNAVFIDRKDNKKSWSGLVKDLGNIREEIITNSKKKYGKQKLALYLNGVGDLYREPKSKYCYKMREEGKRLEFIKALMERHKSTPDILEHTGMPTADALSKASRAINKKTKFYLHLDEKLIESKPRSGYWINTLYTIKPVKK